MGRLRPESALGEAASRIELPSPRREGGKPLMQALNERQSQREFRTDALPMQLLWDLLWAMVCYPRH